MMDSNSVTGHNLRRIMLSCDLKSIHELNCSAVDHLVYSEIPNAQIWRIDFIHELLAIRQGEIEVRGFTSNDISDMLDNVCIS